MQSIFSKIISGQIPCYKIAENDAFMAFLDMFPLKLGHTLIVPKKQIDDLFDLDPQTYLGLMVYSKHIAKAIKKAIPCNRIGVSVIGLEVPHAHIHLVPINSSNDINFQNAKIKLTHEEFEDVANRIKQCIDTE